MSTLAGGVVAPYGSYSGGIEVSWSRLYFNLDEFDRLELAVRDLAADPECLSSSLGYNSSIANSCGIHVHENFDCDDAGGHHWVDVTAEDPWPDYIYTSSYVHYFNIPYQNDMNGRAIVVHDRAGNRIACALAEQYVVPTATVVHEYSNSLSYLYPEYEGGLNTEFFIITASLIGTDQVYLELTGLTADPQCNGITGDAANSCGIHFHTGTSCTDDSDAVGGHFYDTSVDPDPWLIARYVQSEDGALIVNGVNDFLEPGRVLVVHDFDGNRIACVEPFDATMPPASPTDAPTDSESPSTTITIGSAAVLAPMVSGLFALVAGYLFQ